MHEEPTTPEVTIRGIVIPTEWDTQGNVLRVCILTPGERQYDVSESGLGRGLLCALREEVEARVRIDEHLDGLSNLTVLSYTVVDAPDDVCDFDAIGGEPDRIGW